MADEPGSQPEDADGEVAVARETLLRKLVTFTRSLRQHGAEVSADATLVGAQALATVGLRDRDRVRTALQAAFITRKEDIGTYEELFPAFWNELATTPDRGTDGEFTLDLAAPSLDDSALDSETGPTPDDEQGMTVETRLEVTPDEETAVEPDDEGEETPVYSPTGRPEPVEASPGLLGVDDAITSSVRELTDALANRRGRRWTVGGDTRPDVRRALRRSVETGGTILDLPGRERRETAVRVVVLVDVSRSVLDTIDRGFLVSFLRTVRQAWRDVAVFFFDTEVREVSEAFDAPTIDDALSALEAAEAAWGGGTRIGHAIETVRREHPTLVDRDTVVLVISDGLEVGEIDVLEREMAWVSRQAATVLWANPLASAAAYEPTCRGMAAALPYLDGLFAFTGPDDVAEMARQLARYGPGDRVGYQYDTRSPVPRKR